jgi:hypothetical protein
MQTLLIIALFAAEPADPLVGALHGTLAKNIEHAREWLDAKDFKSLAQSAGGLQMLAGLLKARSDDAAWQEATGKISTTVTALQDAAKTEDMAKSQAALDALEKQLVAAKAIVPSGKPQPPPSIGAIRPVMLLMDGIYADAKIFVIAGNVAGAKRQAHVLSELGRVVSNSQSGNAKGRDKWPEFSKAFVEACLAAAKSPSEDAQAVRQLLRGISQRCEACHETR